MSFTADGRGRSEGNSPDEQPLPLDVLASQVIYAKLGREAVKEELDRLPRWRFRRRAKFAREIARKRRHEQRLIDLVREN